MANRITAESKTAEASTTSHGAFVGTEKSVPHPAIILPPPKPKSIHSECPYSTCALGTLSVWLVFSDTLSPSKSFPKSPWGEWRRTRMCQGISRGPSPARGHASVALQQ